MKKFLFIIIVFAFLLSGCEEPTKYPDNSPNVLLAKNYVAPPTCGEGSQIKPTNLTPDNNAALNADSVDLTWDFEGCEIYSFNIYVSTNPNLNYFGAAVWDQLPETEHSYTVDLTGLKLCTPYYWKVAANGAETYESNIASFIIDPGTCPSPTTCEYGISTPQLVSPISYDANETFGPNPQLVWSSFDTCLPANYHYEVSRTPDFSHIVFEGDTLGQVVSPSEPYLTEDCSTYFWRVITELNGTSWSSLIGQFRTDFGDGCESSICSAEQLTAPTIIQPADNSVVTTMYLYFMWNYDNAACQPGYFMLELDDDPAFQSPTLLDSGVEQYSILDDDFWFDFYMSNCRAYYWRVTAYTEDGQSSVQSEISSFIYNTGHAVCAFAGNTGQAPVEVLNDLSLGCVSGSQMWVLYDFKGPVCGDFEVHIGNRTWPCEFVKGSINQLICFGPLASQQTELPVELFMVGGEEPILTREGTTPQCAGAVTCQPPAEGCSPQNIGIITPMYVPTHWDGSRCACVP